MPPDPARRASHHPDDREDQQRGENAWDDNAEDFQEPNDRCPGTRARLDEKAPASRGSPGPGLHQRAAQLRGPSLGQTANGHRVLGCVSRRDRDDFNVPDGDNSIGVIG